MNKTRGYIAIVVGIVMILLAFFAHSLGIGGATMGLRHYLLLVVGLVIGVAGIVILVR